MKVGQEIEVRPGIVSKTADGKVQCRPIFSKIVSLFAEQNQLQYAVPGGLIGVGTKIDPTLCRGDRLVSNKKLFNSNITSSTCKCFLGWTYPWCGWYLA